MTDKKNSHTSRHIKNLILLIPTVIRIISQSISLMNRDVRLMGTKISFVIILSIVFAFLLILTWLSLLALLCLYLKWSWMFSLICFASFHFILLLILGFFIIRMKDNLFFPETRKLLDE